MTARMRITVVEEPGSARPKRTGPFDTQGPVKFKFTASTPDYSEYTGVTSAWFEIEAPPHTIPCGDDADTEITIEIVE